MLLQLLTLAQSSAPPSMPMDQVAYLIITIVVSLTGGGFIGKKVSDWRRPSGDPPAQALLVKLEEKFVTRDDFKEYKSDTRSALVALEGLFRETMTKMDERDRAATAKLDLRDERLTEKIEAAVEKGVDGRVAIWNDIKSEKERVNTRLGELGQRIAKTETATELGRSIERGFESLAVRRNTRG